MSSLDFGIGIVAAIVVAILFRRSAWRDRQEHDLWVSTHPQVMGVVGRMKVHSGGEHSTSYTPVILYTLPNGQRYEIDGRSSGSPAPAVGTEVAVAYDAAIPSTARPVEPPPWTGDLGIGDVISFFLVTAIAAGIATFIRTFVSAIIARL